MLKKKEKKMSKNSVATELALNVDSFIGETETQTVNPMIKNLINDTLEQFTPVDPINLMKEKAEGQLQKMLESLPEAQLNQISEASLEFFINMAVDGYEQKPRKTLQKYLRYIITPEEDTLEEPLELEEIASEPDTYKKTPEPTTEDRAKDQIDLDLEDLDKRLEKVLSGDSLGDPLLQLYDFELKTRNKIDADNFEYKFSAEINTDDFKRTHGSYHSKQALEALPIINKIFRENEIFNILNVEFSNFAKVNETKHNIISELYLPNEDKLLPILVESNIHKLIKSIFTHTTNQTNLQPDRIKKLDVYKFIEQATTSKNKTFITSYLTYVEIKNVFENNLVEKANRIIKLMYEKTPTHPNIPLMAEVYIFNQIVPKLIKIKDVKLVENTKVANIVTNKLVLSVDDNPENNITIYAINAPTTTVNTIEANGTLKIAQPFFTYYFDQLISSGYSATIGEYSGYLIETVETGVQAYNINELLGILEGM